MDQREWDAGARLPRDRHATHRWSPQNGPESTEKPPSGTVADTGSLQPSPEALAWAQRAEVWAEQPPDDEPPTDIAPNGRETYPVDGVSWRTETAGWMAAEQTERWRQTTEWRSATGDHGWRSTTEAWQTSGNAGGFRPPEDTSTRQLSISGTAWATDQPRAEPEPAQPQTFTTRGTPTGWQQFDGGPTRQQAPDVRPAWQQFTTPHQQGPQATPPGDHPPDVSTPVWRPGNAGFALSVDSADTAGSPPWQPAVPAPPAAAAPPQSIDTANTVSSPPWQQSVVMPEQRTGEGSSWQQLIEPARPTTYVSSGSAGLPHNGAERSGERDVVEPWSHRHRTDTPRWDDGDNWDDRTGGPAATPRWRPDDSDLARRDPANGWRSEPDSGSWSRGEEPRTANWRRRRLADVDDDTDAPGWRDAGPHTDGWRRDARPAADPWAQHAADTGFIPMSWDHPGTHGGSWRSDPEDRKDHEYGARRRERPPADEAVTEVRQRFDPEGWQQGLRESGPLRGEGARGPAMYRGGNTGDWRRELAGESDLGEGEARRYGTQDYVPFRPAGPAPAPIHGSPNRPEPVSTSGGPRWQDPPDTQWPPRDAVTGSYEQRAVGSLSNASGRSNLLEPDDDIEENTGGPLAAVGYTVIWYGVPVVLFVLYMLVVTGDAKAHALSTLANAAPQFGLSLALSMLVAVVLRWLSGSWKAASVGLAAAVMGGGLATVLTSAITGNPLS